MTVYIAIPESCDYGNSLLLMAMSNNVYNIETYVSTYRGLVEFNVIEIANIDNMYGYEFEQELIDILYDMGVPDIEYYVRNSRLYDADDFYTKFYLVVDDDRTIHNREFLFTMEQLNQLTSFDYEHGYTFSIVQDMLKSLTALKIITPYIKHNQDFIDHIKRLLLRYIVMSATLDGRYVEDIVSFIYGLTSNDIMSSGLISQIAILRYFMLDNDLESGMLL